MKSFIAWGPNSHNVYCNHQIGGNNKIVMAYCLSFIDFIEPIHQQLFPIRLSEILIHLLNSKAMFDNII